MRVFSLNSVGRLLNTGFLTMALIPALFIGLGTYYFSVNFLTENYLERLQIIADEKFNEFQFFFEERQRDIHAQSINPAIAESLQAYTDSFDRFGQHSAQFGEVEEERGFYLSQLREEFDYKDIFLISAAGDIVDSILREADFGTNLNTGPYRESGLATVFQEAISSNAVTMSPIGYYAPSSEEASFIAAPVIFNGELLGVFAAQFDLGIVNSFATDYTGLGETGEIVVASRISGIATVIAPLRHQINAEFRMTFEEGLSEELPIIRALNGEVSLGTAIDYRGEPIVAVWNHAPVSNWGIVVKMDSREIFSPITRLRNFILQVSVLVILIALALGAFVYRKLSAPISILMRATRTFAKGEEAKDIDIPKLRELGELAISFNIMRKSLNAADEKLRAANQTLEKRVHHRTEELLQVNVDLNKAMDELQNSQSAAAQLEKMAALGTLAAGVGHELNNPLMGILNYVEYAENHSSDAKVVQVLAKTRTAVDRMKDIIQNMMSYSHGSSKATEAVNLNQLLDQVLELLSTDFRHKNIRTQLDMEDSLPAASGNANEIHQCILNLLLNARDALLQQKDRNICFKSYHDSNFVYLEIKDNGPGVPDDISKKIFEPFFTTKVTGKGTGLGLSVSYNLIKNYGGELQLLNSRSSRGGDGDGDGDGDGAIFRIQLKNYEAES